MTTPVRVKSWLRDRLLPPAATRLWHQRRVAQTLRPSSTEAEVLQRNKKFSGRGKGRRCFVIGNGPSLGAADLEPLGTEATFVVTHFGRHPILEKWKPTYFCVGDPLHLRGGSEKAQTLLRGIQAEANFFLLSDRELVGGVSELAEEDTFFVQVSNRLPWEYPQAMDPLDVTQTVARLMGGVQLAIILAIYMRYSPIYLLGLDHDWLAKPGEYSRFFDGDPDNVDELGKRRSYAQRMDTVLTLWRIYEAYRQAASAVGVQIRNATAGGFLDVFERVDYESITG